MNLTDKVILRDNVEGLIAILAELLGVTEEELIQAIKNFLQQAEK